MTLSCQNTPRPADGIISRADVMLCIENKRGADPANDSVRELDLKATPGGLFVHLVFSF